MTNAIAFIGTLYHFSSFHLSFYHTTLKSFVGVNEADTSMSNFSIRFCLITYLWNFERYSIRAQGVITNRFTLRSVERTFSKDSVLLTFQTL